MKENDKNQPNTKSIKLNHGDKVWIKDQNGIEQPWKVEQENDWGYEIFHEYATTHIHKDRFYVEFEEVTFDDKYNNSNKTIVVEKVKYDGVVWMPEEPEAEVTQYFIS